MTNRKAEADRCTVIKDVEGVAADAKDLSEPLDDRGQMALGNLSTAKIQVTHL